MKEAVVSKGPTVQIIDSPIPKAEADQVVIKVVVSGSNPKDWKLPLWMGTTLNQGDDIAGVVHEVGENVFEFKPGDRVAAFHEMTTPGGSYAEYAVAWQHTTFHIPKHTTFEEAAAIPLAAMTSAIGLYLRLGLPQPWTPATEPTPLIIYGASSAVGSYAIQLARQSNIHPLICVAGQSAAHVESLIDRGRGDTIVDYRVGDAALVDALRAAAASTSTSASASASSSQATGKPQQQQQQPILYAFDAVSEGSSYKNLSQVLDDKGGAKMTLVLPQRDFEQVIPSFVRHSLTNVGCVHKLDEKERSFGFTFFRYFARGLLLGWFRPQPQEVVPGGLHGVQGALERLRDGKANAVKFVFRIRDTEGVEDS